MATIFLSPAILNAHTLEEVVNYVNEGTCEGMEGIEFTSEMLAGQYAWSAAKEASDGESITSYHIEGQLEFLSEAGARFDETKATLHGLALASADDE
mgnify:FL=1|jgi:hypothetical protein|tara:strand:+ start:309 stop:599 length:291 start_codon:yes stop_codon:yes gene_type:complete